MLKNWIKCKSLASADHKCHPGKGALTTMKKSLESMFDGRCSGVR